MGFIQNILNKHKQKVAYRNTECCNLISEINTVVQEIKALFLDTQSFVDPCKEDEWLNYLITGASADKIKKVKKATSYRKLTEKHKELLDSVSNIKQKIKRHNEQVAINKISAAYELIGNVEGQQLDHQQMTCIVKEMHNHLIIAGAGTGKTTTVIGKIKYLLKTGTCNPSDILVLSFTNASASEMSQRINQETGYIIDASTFHKLGLNIIKEVNNIAPKITQLHLRKFIKEQLLINMETDSYLNLLSSFLLYNRVVSKSEFDFQSQDEYEEYLQLNPPKTIQNEVVKSYGEMDIANFLVQNGISYIYEHPYSIDTRTNKYGQYYPDFYLPEYNIYIEYFGINKNGEVPSYFKSSNGMSATQSYQAAIQWKREIHEKNNTIMIECYAYEKFDGNLLDNLAEKLKNHNIKFTPKTATELWEQVSSSGDSVLDGVVEMFETIINLIKSNNYTINTVRELNRNNSNVKNNNIILSLIEPIFKSYNDYLKLHNEIDFNDMILLATQYVKSGNYVHHYKYVIVDEYQDISKSRYTLLKSMRESNNYDLFCVGDDWQSIYRFAGSDIGYILNFEHYWGPSEISKIETTYRFPPSLIEISSNFIMQNPVQIQKSIKSISNDTNFALSEISGYTDKNVLQFLVGRLDDLPQNSTVFFIGRYKSDTKSLNDCNLFDLHYNNVTGYLDIKYQNRIDLKMNFITAHQSKGLQADYVVILNNKKSRMGFPSKIQDAAILSLLLDNSDQYPFSEERRLFYVALTRAKKKVFLITNVGKESEFVLELQKQYGDEIKKEQWTCPKCGGRLIKKSGKYGVFLGCSNYSHTGCKYTRNINSN